MRKSMILATLSVAWSPLAFAASPQPAPSPQLQAKFQQVAEKTCNDDLNQDHFGDYSTIEECVADKTDRMARKYRDNPTAVLAKLDAPAQH